MRKFDHMTANILQMFMVNGSRLKVTARRNVSVVNINKL